ncbi:hypothetical protein EMN47_11815 [Prolixibacteraceae bacterium JC049]|nr:hypothetical protein [Prolixibacteraceae bacterium JC049]
MKGIIFTSFIEMVEEKFGLELSDSIIEESSLASKGVFSSVGTYPFSDMVALVVKLHEKTAIPIADLLKTFGHYLFNVLAERYPQIVENLNCSFSFLAAIDNHIHVEVHKLYPNAELPSFVVEKNEDNQLILLYRSPRKLADLAEGLMEASFNHFQEKIDIEKEVVEEDGSEVRFILKKAQ